MEAWSGYSLQTNSMTSQQIIYVGWFAGIGLLAVLAVVLIARRTWKKFPLFTAYSIFTLLTATGTYLLRAHFMIYSYTYWVCEVVGMFLGLAVVYEVFRSLFSSYDALRRLASNILYWVLLVLVVIGGVVIYTHSAVQGLRYVAAFLVVEESVRIIEVGLIVSLFLFAGAFGLHWRQSVFGIALGLGLYATIELLAITMRAHFGIAATPALNMARGLSFDASLLVWLGYLLVPERVTGQTTVPQRGQLEQWNQAVKELIYQ
jgi:hypothetical protein